MWLIQAVFRHCNSHTKMVLPGKCQKKLNCMALTREYVLLITLLGGKRSDWQEDVVDAGSLPTLQQPHKNCSAWIMHGAHSLDCSEGNPSFHLDMDSTCGSYHRQKGWCYLHNKRRLAWSYPGNDVACCWNEETLNAEGGGQRKAWGQSTKAGIVVKAHSQEGAQDLRQFETVSCYF